jgi:hypothetical protein
MKLTKKILLSGLGIFILAFAAIPVQIMLNFRKLRINIENQNEEAHHIIMKSNHGELLVACIEIHERFPQGAHLISRDLADEGWPSNESAQLIGTNIPPAIQRLNPQVIYVIDDEVHVKLRPLSRSALLWSTNESAYSGNVHLTNGLWFYEDKQYKMKDQHEPLAGRSEAPSP